MRVSITQLTPRGTGVNLVREPIRVLSGGRSITDWALKMSGVLIHDHVFTIIDNLIAGLSIRIPRDSGPCVVKTNHTAVKLACFVWRKDSTLVSTLHFVPSPTGFGSVNLVSTLGTGRPTRHFFTTQGPESRSSFGLRYSVQISSQLPMTFNPKNQIFPRHPMPFHQTVRLRPQTLTLRRRRPLDVPESGGGLARGFGVLLHTLRGLGDRQGRPLLHVWRLEGPAITRSTYEAGVNQRDARRLQMCCKHFEQIY